MESKNPVGLIMNTARAGESVTDFFDFFVRATREIGVEEEKVEQKAKELTRLFFREFGGSQPYIPKPAVVFDEKGLAECFDKYRKGRYSIAQVAEHMKVSTRHAYRVMKEMTERAREARRGTREFTGGGRMNGK